MPVCFFIFPFSIFEIAAPYWYGDYFLSASVEHAACQLSAGLCMMFSRTTFSRRCEVTQSYQIFVGAGSLTLHWCVLRLPQKCSNYQCHTELKCVLLDKELARCQHEQVQGLWRFSVIQVMEVQGEFNQDHLDSFRNSWRRFTSHPVTFFFLTDWWGVHLAYTGLLLLCLGVRSYWCTYLGLPTRLSELKKLLGWEAKCLQGFVNNLSWPWFCSPWMSRYTFDHEGLPVWIIVILNYPTLP